MPKIERDDFWPEDKLTALILLAKDGYSAREIVDRLWEEGFKVTRNAVLGKAHRHNIEVGMVSGAGYLQSQRFGRKGKPKNPIDDLPPKAPLPNRGCCQWPLDDVWCGEHTGLGLPYCAKHMDIAYTGVPVLAWVEAQRLLNL